MHVHRCRPPPHTRRIRGGLSSMGAPSAEATGHRTAEADPVAPAQAPYRPVVIPTIKKTQKVHPKLTSCRLTLPTPIDPALSSVSGPCARPCCVGR